MIDPEFIKRAEEMARPQYEEYKQNEPSVVWKKNNPERFRALQNKYFDSDKGRKAAKRTRDMRHLRMKEAMKYLSENEIEEIKEFYFNRPIGMVVDHIIPLCKNGKHHISNLQYLTPRENFVKASKIIDKNSK